MLLGKAHKLLVRGLYQEALDKALKAKKLDLEEHFVWLCHTIEGKSRYHLGDKKNALDCLQSAKEILAPKLEKEKDSMHLQNIVNDIIDYIEKIEQGDTESDE